MTEAKKKEELDDAVQRCREEEPSLAHSPKLIAEYIGADEGAVKVCFNNMEHRELAAEVAKLPDSFEKREIMEALQTIHITCEDILQRIAKRAKGKDATIKDISAFVRVSEHALKIQMCRLQALGQEGKKSGVSAGYRDAKRTTRTSDMKPQAITRH